MSAIVIKGLRKTFPEAGGERRLTVLDGLDLEFETGRSLAIMGRSGCGKSTLLNLIAGLDRPDGGTIEIDGRDIAALDAAGLARHRARQVGVVFQLHHLLPQCTALENVLMPAYAEGAPARPGDCRQRAEELLERVGLAARLRHKPAALSGGERQRCAIARALLNRPRLLLADEPTGSLDENSADEIVELLLELNAREKLSLIFVTHSRELASRLERQCVLAGGRIREDTRQ